MERKGGEIAFYLFLGICIWLISSCHTKTVETYPRQSTTKVETIQLLSLQALDISENMTPLSTQDDEIFLFVFGLKRGLSDSFQIINSWHSPLLVFDNNNDSIILQQSIDAKESDFISFCLVELDEEENQLSFIEKQLSKEMEKGSFLNPSYHFKMDSLLKYDDFLGWQVLKTKNTTTFLQKEIIFKGRQLMDKYHYKLHIKQTALPNH